MTCNVYGSILNYSFLFSKQPTDCPGDVVCRESTSYLCYLCRVGPWLYVGSILSPETQNQRLTLSRSGSVCLVRCRSRACIHWAQTIKPRSRRSLCELKLQYDTELRFSAKDGDTHKYNFWVYVLCLLCAHDINKVSNTKSSQLTNLNKTSCSHVVCTESQLTVNLISELSFYLFYKVKLMTRL